MNKIDLCLNKRRLNWIKAELEDLGKFERVTFFLVFFFQENIK